MKTQNELEKYTYTTGAFISPFFIKEENKWVWIVREFDDDTFCDGDLISPKEESEHIDDIIETEEV